MILAPVTRKFKPPCFTKFDNRYKIDRGFLPCLIWLFFVTCQAKMIQKSSISDIPQNDRGNTPGTVHLGRIEYRKCNNLRRNGFQNRNIESLA